MKTFDTYKRAVFLSMYVFELYYLCPSPFFMHNGKTVAIGGCAWFVFSGMRKSQPSTNYPVIQCHSMCYLLKEPEKFAKEANREEQSYISELNNYEVIEK